jgi:hypothetical protein
MVEWRQDVEDAGPPLTNELLESRFRTAACGAPSAREDSARLAPHPDEHRPVRPVLLAVDQQLGEGPLSG